MDTLIQTPIDKPALWMRLSQYHFDHLVPKHLWDEVLEKFGSGNASLKAFADKLARKLRWKRHFALMAIWEYKKFVYLGTISSFPVTPSKIIDAVWHEHLLFSKGYRDFCSEVIGRDFDHNPELIPVDEVTATFKENYLQTLALYRFEFGMEPPAEIWYATKFSGPAQPRKNSDEDDSTSTDFGDSPLCGFFESTEDSSPSFDFDGGDFGGGGAGGNWDHTDDSTDGHSDSDSSSDSGSDGDSSCSSCSSGCGGGD